VRQVQIPKAGKPGEFRTLGIPTIYDRVCQQALLNRLEPIFEPVFDDANFGYRRGRSTRDALRKVWCNAPRYSPPSRQIILRLVSQLHSRLLSWDRIAACIGASEYPTGRLEPFPVALIVSERSSPSRVRCAAPQPGARP